MDRFTVALELLQRDIDQRHIWGLTRHCGMKLFGYGRRSGCVLASSEHNVSAYRVGGRVDSSRRFPGSRAGMHPHPRKVVAETLLYVLPQLQL